MKKLIYTALFLAVLFMVTACGDSKDKEERNTDKSVRFHPNSPMKSRRN